MLQSLGNDLKKDSPELSQLCREAYQEYRRGGISSAAYNAIYTVCLEYAQPR